MVFADSGFEPAESLRSRTQWDVLAVSCFDGRFMERLHAWLRQQFGIYDFRTEMGASKAIVESTMDRERFEAVVEAAIRLHQIRQVWLIDHVDCGASGGSKAHASDTAERVFHVEMLDRARDILSQRFPDLEIKTAFMHWDGVDVSPAVDSCNQMARSPDGAACGMVK